MKPLKVQTPPWAHKKSKSKTHKKKLSVTPAIKWIKEQQKKYKHKILYHKNGHEPYVQLPNGKKYWVDGLILEDKVVFEFQGCYWHGCPKCFKGSRTRPERIKMENGKEYIGKISFNALRDRVKRKIDLLRRAGYKVVQIWECDWYKDHPEDNKKADAFREKYKQKKNRKRKRA